MQDRLLVSQFIQTINRFSLQVVQLMKMDALSTVRDTLSIKISGKDYLNSKRLNSKQVYVSSIMVVLFTASVVLRNLDQWILKHPEVLRDWAKVRIIGSFWMYRFLLRYLILVHLLTVTMRFSYSVGSTMDQRKKSIHIEQVTALKITGHSSHQSKIDKWKVKISSPSTVFP